MPKILIVEDDRILRKAYAEELADDGFSVLTAKDGKEGLMLALREKADLILLDILMPVMDGLTMLKNLRTKARGKNVKVIILTNLSSAENISQALNDRAMDYLVKSDWDMDKVVKKIKEKLDK